MTKLEFLDKINDILVGLNTLESDLLGSLYDELMRDVGWHPASELPKEGELVLVSGSFKNRIIGASGAIFSKGEFYVASTFDDPKVSRCIITGIKWWCYPPEED
jgi:hypothetical protein